MTNLPHHPIQPLVTDEHGTLRFRENRIVRYLLDHGGIDLNQISEQGFPNEDAEQFAQLIGYSLNGFSELSYVSDETYETARRMTESGLTEDAARIDYLEAALATVRDGLKTVVPAVFRIHPDDLRS